MTQDRQQCFLHRFKIKHAMKLGAFTNYKYCYNLFYKQFYCHMTQLDKKVMGAPYSYNQGNTKFLQSVHIIICTYETR